MQNEYIKLTVFDKADLPQTVCNIFSTSTRKILYTVLNLVRSKLNTVSQLLLAVIIGKERIGDGILKGNQVYDRNRVILKSNTLKKGRIKIRGKSY